MAQLTVPVFFPFTLKVKPPSRNFYIESGDIVHKEQYILVVISCSNLLLIPLSNFAQETSI